MNHKYCEETLLRRKSDSKEFKIRHYEYNDYLDTWVYYLEYLELEILFHQIYTESEIENDFDITEGENKSQNAIIYYPYVRISENEK